MHGGGCLRLSATFPMAAGRHRRTPLDRRARHPLRGGQQHGRDGASGPLRSAAVRAGAQGGGLPRLDLGDADPYPLRPP